MNKNTALPQITMMDPPKTMAALIKFIVADPNVSEVRRRNLACSIRRFCQVLDKQLEDAPASFELLRRAVEQFHPSKAGMHRQRWSTIRSDVGFALKRAQGLEPEAKTKPTLSDVWLMFEVEARRLKLRRWGLSRLVTFCNAKALVPTDVDDLIIKEYQVHIRNQTFKTKTQQHLRDACQLWNRLGKAVPNLGLKTLIIADNRERYTPSWDELPGSLQQEVESWLTSMSSDGDLLSETGPVRPLRPSSIRSYRYSLLQACAGLIKGGRDPKTITSLRELVEPESAKAALKFYVERNEGKRSQMLHQIAHVLVLVAQNVAADAPDWITTLKRFRSKLAPIRSELKARPKNALRQFADRANIEKLLLLPSKIFFRVKAKKVLTLKDARLMQVAVGLELLLMRPIRRANLVSLQIGNHVLRVGARIHIVIDGSEVKNGVSHDYTIPSESTKLLSFYVDNLLPLFGSNPSNFLFPGSIPGKSKSPEQIGRFFSNTILVETGLEVYPHLLRHFAATIYLSDNPDGIETVRRVLGHRSADTTQRSYAGVHDQIAVDRFDRFVLGIRNAILKETGDR